jgi:PEP-CTERM motif
MDVGNLRKELMKERVMIELRQIALCATVAAMVMAPGAAMAANVLATDNAPLASGITFAVGNFEKGFSVDGTQLGIGLGNYPLATFASTSPISFSGSWDDNGETPTISQTYYFVNPGQPSGVVDSVSVQTSSNDGFGTITGTITSFIGMGTEGTLPPGVPPANIFLANGQPDTLTLPFLTATFVPAAVPEPTSLMMAATAGIMGLGYWLRRRRSA